MRNPERIKQRAAWRLSRYILMAAVALFGFWLEALASPEADNAAIWLAGRQYPDGSFSEGKGKFVDAAEAIFALWQSQADAPHIADGLFWLAAQPAEHVNALAVKAKILSVSTYDASLVVAKLLEAQNEDGGWGLNARFRSNPSNASLAFDALTYQARYSPGSVPSNALHAAATYLAESQILTGPGNAQGYWGVGAQNESSIALTASIVMAASDYVLIDGYQGNDLKDAARKASAWLLSVRDAGGSWGNGDIAETSLCVSALLRVGTAGLSNDPNLASVITNAVFFLKNAQGANGSWGGNVYQTALALRALVDSEEMTIPGPADLTILPLSFNPPNPQAGQEVFTTIQMRNLGGLTVQNAKMRVNLPYLPTPNHYYTFNTLDPGETATVNLSLFFPPGSHTITVTADPDNTASESNESNNISTSPITVAGSGAPLPDLAFSTPAISFSPPSANSTTLITISVSVKNMSGITASNIPVNVFDHELATNFLYPLGQETVVIPSLGVGQTHVVQIQATLSAGNHNIVAIINNEGLIAESNWSNNQSVMPITITPDPNLPDLSIFQGEMVVSDPYPNGGEPVTVDVTVRNTGASNAQNVSVELWDGEPGQGGVRLGETQFLNVVLAGGFAQASFSGLSFSGGEHTIHAIADPSNQVAEGNEYNNVGITTIVANLGPLPDLTVSSLTFNPPNPLAWNRITLTATVNNLGTVPSPASKAEFLRYLPIDTVDIPSIPAGGSTNVSVDWYGIEGSNQIIATVDPHQALAEENENNNTTTITIDVGPSDAPVLFQHNYYVTKPFVNVFADYNSESEIEQPGNSSECIEYPVDNSGFRKACGNFIRFVPTENDTAVTIDVRRKGFFIESGVLRSDVVYPTEVPVAELDIVLTQSATVTFKWKIATFPGATSANWRWATDARGQVGGAYEYPCGDSFNFYVNGTRRLRKTAGTGNPPPPTSHPEYPCAFDSDADEWHTFNYDISSAGSYTLKWELALKGLIPNGINFHSSLGPLLIDDLRVTQTGGAIIVDHNYENASQINAYRTHLWETKHTLANLQAGSMWDSPWGFNEWTRIRSNKPMVITQYDHKGENGVGADWKMFLLPSTRAWGKSYWYAGIKSHEGGSLSASNSPPPETDYVPQPGVKDSLIITAAQSDTDVSIDLNHDGTPDVNFLDLQEGESVVHQVAPVYGGSFYDWDCQTYPGNCSTNYGNIFVGRDPRAGAHITSNKPIQVHAFAAMTASFAAGYLILPDEILGTEYRVPFIPTGIGLYDYTYWTWDDADRILIVATQPDTHISVDDPAKIGIEVSGATLQAGGVYQYPETNVRTHGDYDGPPGPPDITSYIPFSHGTRVWSDKPIGVVYTSPAGIYDWDGGAVQVVPREFAVKDYWLTTGLEGDDGNPDNGLYHDTGPASDQPADCELIPDLSRGYILAYEDATQIEVDFNNDGIFDLFDHDLNGATPGVASVTLNIGGTLIIENQTAGAHIRGSKPIYLSQVWHEAAGADMTTVAWQLTHFFPDLAIQPSGIRFSNANPQPGETFSIEADIHNVGTDVANNVLVRFYDGNPQGSGVQIGTDIVIPSILPQSIQTVSFQISFPASALGPHSIYVWIDPADSIREDFEDNNIATKILWVSAQNSFTFNITTDKTSYVNLEQLIASASVQNTGSTTQAGRVKLTVLDSDSGAEIFSLPDIIFPDLPPSEISNVTRSVLIQNLEGSYILRGELFIEESDVPFAVDETGFTVTVPASGSGQITSTTHTDKLAYAHNEVMTMTFTVTNENTEGSGQTFSNLEADIFVWDHLGNEVFHPTARIPIPTLTPGAFHQFTLQWDVGLTPSTPTGQVCYVYQEIYDNDSSLTYSYTTFTVLSPIAGGVGFSGTLNITPTSVYEGGNVTYNYSVMNESGFPSGSVNVKVETVASPESLPYFIPQADLVRSITAGQLAAIELNDVANPNNSAVSYVMLFPLPSGASFSAGDGRINWTPQSSQVGEYVFLYTATDDNHLLPIQKLTVRVGSGGGSDRGCSDRGGRGDTLEDPSSPVDCGPVYVQ